jgi:hypothetical protein
MGGRLSVEREEKGTICLNGQFSSLSLVLIRVEKIVYSELDKVIHTVGGISAQASVSRANPPYRLRGYTEGTVCILNAWSGVIEEEGWRIRRL